METENNEILDQCKKSNKKPLLVVLLLIFAAIAIIFIVIGIVQQTKAKKVAQAQQEVRDYLEGAIIIDKGAAFENEWVVYSFKNNMVSVEYWNRSEPSPAGDLTYYQDYEVIIEDGFGAVIIKFSNVWLRLKWNERGKLMEPIHDRLTTYREGEIDIDLERKDFFCNHVFYTKVITQATCTTSGEEHKTCQICGYVETIYPAASHDFVSHECSKCGTHEKTIYDGNTWYSCNSVSVLKVQNCVIHDAVVSGNAVVTSYYMFCSSCKAIDNWLQISAPELGYQISKLHTCDECGKITKVLLKVE